MGSFFIFDRDFTSKKRTELHSPVKSDKIFISSKFGEDRGTYIHKGLDIDGKAGDKIYAAQKGTVAFSGQTERGGNEVVIKHNNGLVTKYSHLKELNVQEGDKVNNKTVIGTMGSTGHIHADKSDGDTAHLHYEVMKNGKNIDPELFLDNKKTEYRKGNYGSGSCGGTTSWEEFSDPSGDDTTDNTDSTDDTDDTNNTSNTSSGSCSGTMTDEEVDEKWEEWQDNYGDEKTDPSNNNETNTEDSNTVYDQLRENINKLNEEYDKLDEIRNKQKRLVDMYNHLSTEEQKNIEEKLSELRAKEESLETTIGLRRMQIENDLEETGTGTCGGVSTAPDPAETDSVEEVDEIIDNSVNGLVIEGTLFEKDIGPLKLEGVYGHNFEGSGGLKIAMNSNGDIELKGEKGGLGLDIGKEGVEVGLEAASATALNIKNGTKIRFETSGRINKSGGSPAVSVIFDNSEVNGSSQKFTASADEIDNADEYKEAVKTAVKEHGDKAAAALVLTGVGLVATGSLPASAVAGAAACL